MEMLKKLLAAVEEFFSVAQERKLQKVRIKVRL